MILGEQNLLYLRHNGCATPTGGPYYSLLKKLPALSLTCDLTLRRDMFSAGKQEESQGMYFLGKYSFQKKHMLPVCVKCSDIIGILTFCDISLRYRHFVHMSS